MRTFRSRLIQANKQNPKSSAVEWLCAIEELSANAGVDVRDFDSHLAPISHFLRTGQEGHLSGLPKRLARQLLTDDHRIPTLGTSRLTGRRRISQFTFADLFAGIGGFHLALSAYGGECVFSSEWDSAAQLTYFMNFGIVPYGDIRNFTSSPATNGSKTAIQKIVKNVDIISGGFPCQPFSLAGVSSRNHHGLKHGLDCETQGTLFHDILVLARALRPKALLLENVRNIASHDGGRTIRVILEGIKDAGYVVFPADTSSRNWAILDSQLVSAQRRKRVYLVCVRRDLASSLGPFVFPNLIADKGIPRTIGQVIAQDTMCDAQKFDLFGISRKLERSHQRRDRDHASRGNGFKTNLITDPNQPSPTLVARYFKDGKDCLIPHPSEIRPPRMLSPRECSILQTFPDSFWIHPSKSVAYKQFGNSITVEVVRQIAKRLIKYLEPTL